MLRIVALVATMCCVGVHSATLTRSEPMVRSAEPVQPVMAGYNPQLVVQPNVQLVADEDMEARRSRMPRYAKVSGNIETLWQPPQGPEVKGILFLAHGCQHQATDFFYGGSDALSLDCARSNFGSCLALPEERQLVEEARGRGLYVVAVSGGGGKKSCWARGDAARVKKALDHVIATEGLSQNVPVIATGASSGGAFMLPLVLEKGHNFTCVIPQISPLGTSSDGDIEAFADLQIPTLFVHMPVHDKATAARVSEDIRDLQEKKVRVQELTVSPVPVLDELSAHYPGGQAQAINNALEAGGLLKDGYLTNDPRKTAWKQLPGLIKIQDILADSFKSDESKLAELLNVAWAGHEFTGGYAKSMLDFCEGSF